MKTSDLDTPLVLIVDDDSEVRTALVELVRSVGLDAAEFPSAQALLEADLHARPGCLILDIRLPGPSGLDFHDHLRARGIEKPVIFLTGHGDIQMSVQAMKAGAEDFFAKPVRDQDLIDAIMAAIEKDRANRSSASITRQYTGRYESLTARERQVMREVAKGRVNKQIAHDLGISVVTVKLHRSNAMRKMNAVTVADLIRAWDSLPETIRQKQAA